MTMTNEDRLKARERKLRRLKNVTVSEVSLVDNPANNRRFLLYKSADGALTEEPKGKHRLHDIKVHEVSLVDQPANMRKFLLFKSTGVHAAHLVNVVEQYDEAEINAAFNSMSAEKQIEFLESLKSLNKKLDSLLPKGSRDDDDTEGAEFQYEFGKLTLAQKEIAIAKLRKCAEEIDRLENSNLSLVQKAALVDTWRTQIGLIKLGLRSPELLDELNKATDQQLRDEWIYELSPEGIPIIMKRVSGSVLGETNTHVFKEVDGKWAWYPRQKRDQQGRFTSTG